MDNISAYEKALYRLKVEIESRQFYIIREAINYSEFFNDINIIGQTCRDSIAASIGKNKEDIELLAKVLQRILAIQARWFNSYTAWLQAYKSDRNNREILALGVEYVYIHYQIFYPCSVELEKDITLLRKDLEQLVFFIEEKIAKETLTVINLPVESPTVEPNTKPKGNIFTRWLYYLKTYFV